VDADHRGEWTQIVGGKATKAIFTYPPAFDATVLDDPIEILEVFCVIKLESLGYCATLFA